MIRERYSEMLQRLSFYAVDIEKHLTEEEKDSNILPKVIKAIEILEFNGSEIGNITITEKQVIGKKLLQGDFIVFVDAEHMLLHEMFVYQVTECKKKGENYEISYKRRHVVNPKRQGEILKMIKEA